MSHTPRADRWRFAAAGVAIAAASITAAACGGGEPVRETEIEEVEEKGVEEDD